MWIQKGFCPIICYNSRAEPNGCASCRQLSTTITWATISSRLLCPPGLGAEEYSSFGRPYLVPLVTEFYCNCGNEKNHLNSSKTIKKKLNSSNIQISYQRMYILYFSSNVLLQNKKYYNSNMRRITEYFNSNRFDLFDSFAKFKVPFKI